MTRSSITIYEAEKISYADIPSYKSRLKNKGFNLDNICVSPSCICKGYYAITAIKEGWYMNIDDILKDIKTPKITVEHMKQVKKEVKKDPSIVRLDEEIKQLKDIKKAIEAIF